MVEDIRFKKMAEFCQKIIDIVEDNKDYWDEEIIIPGLIKALDSFVSVRLEEVAADDIDRIAGLFFLLSSQIDLRIFSQFYVKFNTD